jgi:tRNA threonylcarbamoyladenosine biosynthesis protein TsaB
VRALLDEAGIRPGDLAAVAVSVGPGSYTGLRIGVAAAKTLAWALSLRAVAVSTLEALAACAAAGAPEGTRRLVPVIDARRGRVYSAAFLPADGGIARESEDAALDAGRIPALLRPGDHVFGDVRGVEIPAGATSAGGPRCPSAATVAALGLELARRGRFVEPHDLAPAYLMRTEAELRLLRASHTEGGQLG